ncbi:glycosyltransferase [Priestia endophytica]|uniref:glycosyltransferase n=1 Tax=Priestia endophytica TaxID=135735 RepID=UPI000F53E83D|nr:glycosyltransferase [Priestia endophytica]RPK15252.1 hypothetical protein FH5_00687 [Priestia endophytica]
MEKIKVFHVIPDLGTGGAEKLAIDICSFLDKDKFDVTLVSLYEPQSNIYEKLAIDSGLKVLFLNKKKGFDYRIFFKLNKLFRKEKPDIIHTHLYVGPYVLIPMILNRVKGRIHTVHNIASKELRSSKRKIMSLAYKYFNVIPVAISDYIKETIKNEYDMDLERIPCIYNGIDTEKFSKVSNINNDFTFIHVGRFSPQKNHELLIDSFAKALEENPNILLKLVGDGNLKTKIEKKVQDLGIEDKIIFRGIQKDITKELNAANAFVLSSDWEGLPISVLEAMSCGLPIISTKCGGTPDVVKHNQNGILVNLGDKEALSKAMLNVSSDYSVAEKMGDKSFLYSKQYDIRQTCKSYSSLYRNLLEN